MNDFLKVVPIHHIILDTFSHSIELVRQFGHKVVSVCVLLFFTMLKIELASFWN